jgi:hypothetical protein
MSTMHPSLCVFAVAVQYRLSIAHTPMMIEQVNGCCSLYELNSTSISAVKLSSIKTLFRIDGN